MCVCVGVGGVGGVVQVLGKPGASCAAQVNLCQQFTLECLRGSTQSVYVAALTVCTVATHVSTS